MARRWQRGRKGGETDRPVEPQRAPRAEPPPDDLESRLGPASSAYRRPPTADELRAAFGRRERAEERTSPEPPSEDFASRYPTETLFVATPADDEPAVDERVFAEDRSRTSGDYYYDPEDAWGVLGVQPGSSWKVIAAAHRRLAMRHHPDRLLDATPEQRTASEETMREVNVAYNVLRRLTGN
jgi:hypothetical protein